MTKDRLAALVAVSFIFFINKNKVGRKKNRNVKKKNYLFLFHHFLFIPKLTFNAYSPHVVLIIMFFLCKKFILRKKK